MSFKKAKESFSSDLEEIKKAGLWKTERIINSDQKSKIQLSDNQEVINMCANNYLGLANNPEVIQAAKDGLDRWGFGLASVRFICGTQTLHKTLEEKVSEFLGTEDTILYAACFDANGGLFETILTADDAVISDELNHASIIDGIRLCKAQRYRYKNNDMNDLRAKLQEAKKNKARRILITTDGVFSMDGTIAQLDKICDLADEFDAMVHHDDCHATGFMGKTGRGIHEYCNVIDRVDIITSTFGKALGGATGGFTSGRKEIIDMLRQRSRPYLFSNTLAPNICTASLKVFEMLKKSTALRDTLEKNVHYFRSGMQKAGFDVSDGDHPIVPIMLGDANLAQSMSIKLLEKGIFAIGFFYPVVPQGKARIRTQISAAHTFEDLDKAIDAFATTKDQLA
ncbi:glycine C-acetyltransferase [Candidatus Methylopumilus universalis]|uniref:2-amino-3-ketobutyrate coenzyme A ligase n=1 Tax=Candidatus Methylopumilus universalis TaxID=2588536 RepID=A0AAX1EZM6_9PROT|nr:glycine C-acetyltransferase [Candidatus Methylopumilus universalis]QDC40949.1 glycine C-acetyltransferase [Candidatus Methylopumilus universalis]QDC42240.1 glycine C-acetyltransferase [Candidatus Methylopumilus universalis]QDC54626.1 glycine C-acetyltransferase [Candidatus Methylopumilus universalis]QDC55906.1 glycine C-acetyltransferase [Candidatus Methylopumilus universalis]QDC57189.1 glycine C-acetyltransferase [Candidatus Methylopumilus universalis]